MWSAELGGGCWNPTFVRHFNNWEMDDVESLLCWIGWRRVIEGVEDKVRLIGSKNGLFSIKSLYKALEQRTPSSFPWKSIWKTCVQPIISLFAWEATWGKILTCDQLQKRGLSHANCCPLYLDSEEGINGPPSPSLL